MSSRACPIRIGLNALEAKPNTPDGTSANEGTKGRLDIGGHERAEAERPAPIDLLPEGERHPRLLQGSRVPFGSRVAARPLKGGIEPVAPIVHRPDSNPVGDRPRRRWGCRKFHAEPIGGRRAGLDRRGASPSRKALHPRIAEPPAGRRRCRLRRAGTPRASDVSPKSLRSECRTR